MKRVHVWLIALFAVLLPATPAILAAALSTPTATSSHAQVARGPVHLAKGGPQASHKGALANTHRGAKKALTGLACDVLPDVHDADCSDCELCANCVNCSSSTSMLSAVTLRQTRTGAAETGLPQGASGYADFLPATQERPPRVA